VRFAPVPADDVCWTWLRHRAVLSDGRRSRVRPWLDAVSGGNPEDDTSVLVGPDACDVHQVVHDAGRLFRGQALHGLLRCFGRRTRHDRAIVLQ
jgi:hypothetical protein